LKNLLAAESHGAAWEAKHETVATVAHALLLNMSKVAKLRKKVLTKQVLNVDTVNSIEVVPAELIQNESSTEKQGHDVTEAART
jgi:hypothetical protein